MTTELTIIIALSSAVLFFSLTLFTAIKYDRERDKIMKRIIEMLENSIKRENELIEINKKAIAALSEKKYTVKDN